MEQATTGAEAIAREKERISSSYKLKISGRSENSSLQDKGSLKYPVPNGLINQRSNKDQIDLSLSRVTSDLEPAKPISW